MPSNPPIKHWPGRRVWLIGASSGIGRALAHELHARGAQVVVSARGARALQEFVDTHAGAEALPLDVTDAAATAAASAQLQAQGPLDLVLYCVGCFKPMRATAIDLDELLWHQQVNYAGALHVVASVIPGMLVAAAAGRQPHFSVVSSVAGLRGLPQGLAYGPPKAALIHLAETLYLDLHPKGVGVSVIEPGFVETPMTAQNEFPMPAMISAEHAARAILRGWSRGSFAVHFPRRFTGVLKALQLLPYRWYFPLVRRVTGL